jgi:hypothetical protein
VDGVSKHASRLDYVGIFRSSNYSQLFKVFGGRIMSNRMLYFSRTHPVMAFIERILSYAFELPWVDRSQYENLRVQFTRQIFQCLMATDEDLLHEYLTRERILGDALILGLLADTIPAVAAAIEDADMLLCHVDKPTALLQQSSELFPNAIDAAVASGNMEVLSVILDYLKHNVKGKPEAQTWEEMRAAARGIGQGPRVVIRLHKRDAGLMIFKFLADNGVFRKSTGLFFEHQLVRDCMRHGNVDLIYGSFAFKELGSYDPAETEKPVLSTIAKDEENFLFKHGHPSTLRALIKHGLFDPNACKQSTSPLQFALSKWDYKRARILLDHGAKVDAVTSKETGNTALWIAAEAGHDMDVKLLLEYGASPVHPDAIHSPLQIAESQHHNKCRFLLKKVHEHGKGYLERSDLWKIYDEETAYRHRFDHLKNIHDVFAAVEAEKRAAVAAEKKEVSKVA